MPAVGVHHRIHAAPGLPEDAATVVLAGSLGSTLEVWDLRRASCRLTCGWFASTYAATAGRRCPILPAASMNSPTTCWPCSIGWNWVLSTSPASRWAT